MEQTCRRELSEAKARLRDQGRRLEEAGAREEAHAQVGNGKDRSSAYRCPCCRPLVND